MDLGLCPRCSTAYTAAEVAGLGILRARPASEGGPHLEYRCARCRVVIVLIPHGEGRYAPPGAAPPESVPPEARRPLWVGAPPAPGPGPARPPEPPPAAQPPPRPSGQAPPDAASPDPAGPMTLVEALALLGVGPTAEREEIERAFRARSLACHPDKVTHLDPEFLDLATRKFKRLKEAHRLLLEH